MKRRVIVSLCLIFAASMSIFGQQNARVESMGQNDIMPDISRIIYSNPVYINNYKNKAQLSFNSPLLGTKSIGDMVTLGAVFSRGLMLDSSFYNAGNAALAPSPVGTPNSNVPHILLGLDFSTIKLAIDGFWESNSISSDTTISAPTVTSSSSTNSTINHFGANVGADIKLADLNLVLLGGVGFPTIYRKQETGATSNETKSEKGLSLRFGAEVQFPAFTIDWNAGAEWDILSYQFKTAAGNKQNDNIIHTIYPYIGLHKEILDKVYFVAMDKIVMRFSGVKLPLITGSNEAYNNYTYNMTSFGVEKQFANAWVFDSLALRGGANYSFVNYYGSTKVVTTAPSTTETTYSNGITNQRAQPYLGFGVSKSFFTCDVSVSPSAWLGVFVGPPVGRCTATLAF